MSVASKINGKVIQFFIEGRVLHVEVKQSLRKKCPYSELFWSAFSRIWTEYREILYISPYSLQIRENADQNNSECGHFLRSDAFN